MPTPEIDPPVLRIAAAMLVRADGRTLLVRKRHTTIFMQPGGRIDAGETVQSALVRELKEELGISVDIQSLVPLGQFLAPAANEAGVMVDAALFMVECDQAVQPAAEIEQAIWLEPDAPRDFPIAPLTDDYVLPLHKQLCGKSAHRRD
ncbi:NUDIX domain-containing protein [Bradyrhizobium sp. S69]|uniref:NUDIX hydrolase n=1 Tax=Bradyrhizobium sp. S69 TaxID=1641856 RepID=UPI00131B0B1F|nr:NUDIX domain-containing protein [Bradyrhizobium sp. S69]